MSSSEAIWLVPFFGQGHLFPFMELCKRLASCNYKTILVISSKLSSSIPPSLRENPLVEINEMRLSPPSGPPPPPEHGSGPLHQHHPVHNQMAQSLQDLLMDRSDGLSPGRPICAVVDVMMSWTKGVFEGFRIPVISFFTSGACSAAMEYAIWKADLVDIDIKPGETCLLPGLPEDMAITRSDLKQRPHGPPGRPEGPLGLGDPPPPGGPRLPPPPEGGPPRPGGRPPWVEELEGSMALMINTCDDLERMFIQYIVNQTGKPVWGIGPLLPEKYWKSDGSLVRDNEIRTNRRSNVTEEEVIQWLDSKPHHSVLYVSFGSEVGPTFEEYARLAKALEESNRPSIWVIQLGLDQPGILPGYAGLDTKYQDDTYLPRGLDKRVGERGMIIHGWAPQLLILSHASTGGFLSHGGWNSTVEAIGRGVPLLVWPIRGDQFYNEKLVVRYHKVGRMVCDDPSEMIKKDDLMRGIDWVMNDEDVRKRAKELQGRFENGFPEISLAALDSLGDFISQKCKKRNN